MIVGIDATSAVAESVSGVGYHIIRLLEALDASAPADVEFRIFFQAVDGVVRRRAASSLPSSSRMRLVAVPFVHTSLHTLHRAFARFVLPTAVRHQQCDVFHGPSHVVPRIGRTPTIVTIHDLAFFKHDLYEPALGAALREVVMASMLSATAVIALSEHTRADVRDIAGRTDDVHVIYGAGNYATGRTAQMAPDDERMLAGLAVRRPYVLYVGDFNRRKNLPYLVASFARFKRTADGTPFQLVLAGNSRDGRGDLEACAAAEGLSGPDVVFTGRVSDDELPVLYRNASAFTLCSLMEGFTLVTLEAMSYGVPVVATDTSSIAEGTGAAAELVPLNDPDAVARGIAAAVATGPRREQMIRMGVERVAKFSWSAAASHTLTLYRSTCRSGARDYGAQRRTLTP